MLNTHSNDFIPRHNEHMMSCKYEIPSDAAERCEGGVAGKGKLVGVPKFHSWGKCSQIGCPTLPLARVLFLSKYCMLVLNY